MATPEEIAYYQSLSEEDKRRYTRQMAQEYQGRGATGEPISQSPKLRPAPAPSPQKLSLRGTMPRKPREPKPAPPAPSPPPPKQSLGGRLLGGAKDFLTSDWMTQGSARVQGRAPPRRKGRQSETMAWLGRASENISRMDMNFVPPGMMMGPEAPEPKRRSRKKKGRRAPPIEEEVRPWDMNYVPPHLRRFF